MIWFKISISELSACTKSLFKSILEEDTFAKTPSKEIDDITDDDKTRSSTVFFPLPSEETKTESPDTTDNNTIRLSTNFFPSVLDEDTNTPTPPQLATLGARTMFKPPVSDFNSTFEVLFSF